MASIKDFMSGKSDLFKIDPRIIKTEPGFNVRQETPELEEHIANLAASIRELGVQTPLTVRATDDGVIVVDGHCRLRAVMRAIEDGADIETVPCVPETKYASDADRHLMLLTRNSGRPLEPLEKAEVFKRLLGFGWNEEQIARRAGISTKQVGNLLTLSAAPVEVKEMVSAGEVSATTALRAIQAEGGAAATETLKEAVQEAKASGKTKVTPKAVNAVRTAKTPPQKKPEPEDEDEDETVQPIPASGPPRRKEPLVRVPPAPPLIAMPTMTPKSFRQMVETLHAIRKCNDIKLIHTYVDDVLKPKAA